MAKGKSQRALFEILTKERAQVRQQAEAKPGPIVRRYGGEEGGGRQPPAPARPAMPVGGPPAAPVRVSLTAYWVVVAAVAVACLCALFYLWGTRSRREPVPPNVEPRPTMEEVGRGPVNEGFVGRREEATVAGVGEGTGARAGAGTGVGEGAGAGVGEAAGPAEQGKFRLRIARLEVSRSEYTDQLRTLLASRGVETDLATRGGYFILYSRERFVKMDDEKATAFEKKVVEALKEFEQKTGWPAATNPYFVTVP
ncbi:MAG: hypothetical protein NTX40_02135 [Planctomycetota bacterium]|nr:hypothetical protein [Planctomycetota bacterium]